MRKGMLCVWFVVLSVISSAQVAELEQLALNIEKLAQFRQILTDLKKAYDILYTGYNRIKGIASGNFNLHKTFLDGLLDVHPVVKQYKKTGEIVTLQLQLVKEYKAAWQQFHLDNKFSSEELRYIQQTHQRLFRSSLSNLEALLAVMTAGTLCMSDSERLLAIDRIHADMQSKIKILRQFNNSTTILGVQRMREVRDIDAVRKLYDLK